MMPNESLRNSFPAIPGQPEINEFCHAARDGDIAAVTRFLDQYGASIVNGRDDIEARAITWAAFSGNTQMIELLLDRGADINAGGTYDKPALSWAAESGHHDTVRLLLGRGASLEVRDRDGNTPLDIARRNPWNGIAEEMESLAEEHRVQAAQKAAQQAAREEEAARKILQERLRKLRENAPGGPSLKPSLKKNPRPPK
jgi:ankyrin repeat protein